jgi:hypothetical protein
MSDEPIEIDVKPRERQRLTFNVGGEIYEFRIPKLYGLIDTVQRIQTKPGDKSGRAEMEMFGQIERWLFDAMKPDDATRLQERLRDDDDDLDVDTMVALFQELTKAASRLPSGSRRSD